MSYTSAAGRQQLLDQLAAAAEKIALALACLSEAYEHLDDHTADRLEDTMFRPVQAAMGRAQRSHARFAGEHGLSERSFPQPAPGGHPGDVRWLLDRAREAAQEADETLATLQDSMLPIEVGDPALREDLAAIRSALDPVPGAARELLRTFGR